MIPVPNFIWKCKNCGEELDAHQDEDFPQLNVVPPKCLKCGGEMIGNPIIYDGPFSEHLIKKY
jgi:uncharacterized protein (DUF983 family)